MAILKTHDQEFSHRPGGVVSDYVSFKGNSILSISANNPLHQRLRRLFITELLSPKKVAATADLRKEHVSSLPAHVTFVDLVNHVLFQLVLILRANSLVRSLLLQICLVQHACAMISSPNRKLLLVRERLFVQYFMFYSSSSAVY